MKNEQAFKDGQWLGILVGGLIACATFLIMSTIEPKPTYDLTKLKLGKTGLVDMSNPLFQAYENQNIQK
jgi:hypothetical protein